MTLDGVDWLSLPVCFSHLGRSLSTQWTGNCDVPRCSWAVQEKGNLNYFKA